MGDGTNTAPLTTATGSGDTIKAGDNGTTTAGTTSTEATDMATGTTTGGSGPGFGLPVALIAVFASIALLARWSD